MKDETGKVMRCEECGSENVIYDYVRSETYCANCGLVKDPIHPMGTGIDGLIDYANHNGLGDQTETIRSLAIFHGLRAARLETARLTC